MAYRVKFVEHDVVYSDYGPPDSVFRVRYSPVVDTLKQAQAELRKYGFMEDGTIETVNEMGVLLDDENVE